MRLSGRAAIGLALILAGLTLLAIAQRGSVPKTQEASPPLTWPSPAAPSLRWQGRLRFGVTKPSPALDPRLEDLKAGWYLNWGTSSDPFRPAGIEYVQLVGAKHGVLKLPPADLAQVALAVPGSLWIIGNEPDRATWQDDATPVQYAQAYHLAYQTLKQADPTALVAIAGVIQPTPLRLRYLDAVLESYSQLYGEPMPVDVWNIHNFILREERGSWGAEIPPGLPDERGVWREEGDNDNLEIFQAQIWAFRQWMYDRGQRNKPLIVSEYGVVMPPEYGFSPERIQKFMIGTLDFFLSAASPELGYPPDGNRLVQRWCWYSLGDTDYPAGNLFAPDTAEITPLGIAWNDYVVGHTEP